MTNPVFPDVRMNIVRAADPVTARVVSNELCMRGKSASFVKHLVLDIGDTPLQGAFRAGQSFGVLAPGEDAQGKPHKVRLYSIACPTWGEDGEARLISTTPKRLIDEFSPQTETDDPDDHHLFLGACSNYLCDLKAGDEVRLTGPNGKRFLLPASPADHDYLFIAAGTGIAPFRGMALELLENPAGPCKSQIHLIMGSPYTTDLLYDDLFRRLAEEHDNFHYHTAISREPRSGGRRGIYVHHLIDENIDVFRPLLAGPRTLMYICGLLGMQNGIYQVLVKHGVEEGYLTIGEELRSVDPAQWEDKQVRRHAKSTPRCMVEVY